MGRVRHATKVLVDFGLLVLVKQGGRGPGDVTLYRFGLPGSVPRRRVMSLKSLLRFGREVGLRLP